MATLRSEELAYAGDGTDERRDLDRGEDIYEKRPDGGTLYERMAGALLTESPKERAGHYASHDWTTVLASYFDADGGRMGYLQLATFSGRSGGGRSEPGDYRGDIILQLLSANAEPVELALSWSAAKALCGAIEVWEQEHALDSPGRETTARPSP